MLECGMSGLCRGMCDSWALSHKSHICVHRDPPPLTFLYHPLAQLVALFPPDCVPLVNLTFFKFPQTGYCQLVKPSSIADALPHGQNDRKG